MKAFTAPLPLKPRNCEPRFYMYVEIYTSSHIKTALKPLASSRRSVSWAQRDKRRAKKKKKARRGELRERLWENLTKGLSFSW